MGYTNEWRDLAQVISRVSLKDNARIHVPTKSPYGQSLQIGVYSL